MSIQAVLKAKFGSEGLKLMADIEKIYAPEYMEAILTALATTSDLEEVRRLLSSLSP